MSILDNKTVLVTGGTGSFGRNFIKFLLSNDKIKKVIAFSRDELKQFQMQQEIKDDRLRFFLGDIRDISRLQRAFRGVDIIVHAAALKQVPTLEYNPFEAVKTNILGSQNVIDAAIDQGVEKVLLISTDKAAQPINLYGSTKLCAEKLFIDGNSYSPDKTVLACVRYGNVLGSRGSILETLLDNPKTKQVSITDEKMTRFWITFDQAFDLVMFALENMMGGEIFIPKIPSMKITELFDTFTPEAEKKFIGIRPGEKLHEVLLTEQESRHALELEKYFVITPEFLPQERYGKYQKSGKVLEENFRFASDTNQDWLTREGLIDLVTEIRNKYYA